MVIFAHTEQKLHFPNPLIDTIAAQGQFGVQLFFVVSAFTLCLSHTARKAEPRAICAFYLRRYFRIAPLYYVGIATYFIVQSLFGTSFETELGDRYSLANITANVVFIHGFVPSANNHTVLGGWSIGTEMAFYLVFPALFVIARRMASIHYWGIALIAALLLAFGIGVGIGLQNAFQVRLDNNNFLYLNLLTQIPVFLIGIFIYFRSLSIAPPRTSAARLATILGMAVFGGFGIYLEIIDENSWITLVMPTSIAVSVCFFLNLLRGLTRIPTWICRIGTVSYSMYVFHFIFAWYVAGAIRPFVFDKGILALAVLYSMAVGCTYLTASATHRLIESEGIALGDRLIGVLRRRATIKPSSRESLPSPRS